MQTNEEASNLAALVGKPAQRAIEIHSMAPSRAQLSETSSSFLSSFSKRKRFEPPSAKPRTPPLTRSSTRREIASPVSTIIMLSSCITPSPSSSIVALIGQRFFCVWCGGGARAELARKKKIQQQKSSEIKKQNNCASFYYLL